MFTAWCLAVVALSTLGLGLPLAWLLGGRRPLAEADYVQAPFLGAAAALLVVQNLFYLDVTAARSAPLVWGAVVLLWLWAWRRGQPPLWWRGRPRGLLAVALLAFAVQGLGLLRLGAREYVGRLFPDQFNYTSIAQFALEQPFSTPLAAVGHRPYLVQGVYLKGHRIGAPLLQAFFAASAGADALPLLEPTILLLPPLAACAAFGLGRRLGLARAPALLAAATAGLLPALAAVHLEGFLSQALCLPFLLAWPVFLGELSDRPSWGRLAAAASCAAAGFSTYAELYPLFLGTAAVLLGVAACGDCRRWRLPACAAALAVAPALLLPAFAAPGFGLLSTLTRPVLQEVYPWAFAPEGLARLWAGDFAAAPWAKAPLAAAAAAATALAFLGLLRPCAAALRGGDRAAGWRGLAVALAVLALALVPVALALKDREHPYQFYKLASTLSPLLAVGLVRAFSPGRAAAAVPALLLAGAASGAMALAATRPECAARSCAGLARGPGLGDLARRLEQGPGGPLLLASADVGHNPWLTYFARRHQVWLLAPRVNDSELFERLPGGGCLADLSRLPDDCLLLTSHWPWLSYRPGADAWQVHGAGWYRLWQTRARTWAVPTAFAAPAGLGEDERGLYFLAGREPARLEVLAICPGELTVAGRFTPRPGGPAAPTLRVKARGPGGDWEREAAAGEGEQQWQVPLGAGTTVLTLQAAGGPAVAVRGLRLRFAAAAASPAPPAPLAGGGD